ncbi:MAG: 4-(cytidine 5'-diphospho)-2-C-methyl-D-erythritol kinase [Chloroflexota bacterium]
MLEIRAPAKINLSLEVVGKRSDGYHDLVSLMQTVSLHDTLSIQDGPSVELTCSDPDLQSESNLVWQAAVLLRNRYAPDSGCRIHLEKRIPVGAGLAGGSSDAAAAIVGLQRLWNLRLQRSQQISIAAHIGSDVPFLLVGGLALVEGRGERVTQLPTLPVQWYVLAKPPFAVSTASIFAGLRQDEWHDGQLTRVLASNVRSGDALELGVNGLQPTLFRLCPEAQRCFHDVARVTAGRCLVSGSGPTVFARCRSRTMAEQAATELRACGYWTAVTHSDAPES